MASISFYDVAGQVRGFMGIDENGTPIIRLMNARGQSRLQAFLENDDAFVVAGGETGQSALFGTVGDAPMLNLSDGQRVRAGLQLSSEGSPALGLFDSEGQRSVTMETDTLGSPFITLYEVRSLSHDDGRDPAGGGDQHVRRPTATPGVRGGRRRCGQRELSR